MTAARDGSSSRARKATPARGLGCGLYANGNVMNLYSACSIDILYSNALYKQVIYGQRPYHNTGKYSLR